MSLQTLPTASSTVATAAILYGSSDPALNLAYVRARQMSPDEMESAGFRDGFGNLGTRGSLYSNPDYSRGWAKGRAARF